MSNQNNIRKLCGTFFEAYESPWDTDYFGVLSAKAILRGIAYELECARLLDFLNTYEFVTIINLANKQQNNYWLSKNTNNFFVDINVQFEKNLVKGCIDSKEPAEVCEAYSRDENMLRIASGAFKYSRFFNDPYLPSDKAKGIYVQWIENAFDKSGRFFSITKKHGVITGFLLFSIDAELSITTIELIAVDEQYRGLRVGKALISGMEHFIKQRNIKKIKVGTQVDNTLALQFYTSCGFIYTSCNSVYHYWPKLGLSNLAQ